MARHPKGVPFAYSGLTDYRMGIPGDSYYWYRVQEDFAKKAIGIAIHHSVTKDVHPDAIAKMHISRWGKSAGVGYHFIISRNGKTWYVGDLGTQRAHVANKNHQYIGICLLGEHHKYAPTKAQYESAHKLVAELQKKFGKKKIVRHKDLQATACPGSYTNMSYIINGYPKPKPAPVTESPAPKPPVVVEPPKQPEAPVAPEVGVDVPTEMKDKETWMDTLVKILNIITKFIKGEL